MRAAVVSVALVVVLRVRANNNYIAALLLVESRRTASDGLEAPARHHLVCGCAGVYQLPLHVRSRSCPWH